MNNWQIINKQAQNNLESGKIWKSFIHEKEYRVLKVTAGEIEVQRVSKGKNVLLTKSIVDRFINRLNKNENTIKKLKVNRAIVNAMIEFHPFIYWDVNSQEVKIDSSFLPG